MIPHFGKKHRIAVCGIVSGFFCFHAIGGTVENLMTQVGVGGIFVILVLKIVFDFLKDRKNGTDAGKRDKDIGKIISDEFKEFSTEIKKALSALNTQVQLLQQTLESYPHFKRDVYDRIENLKERVVKLETRAQAAERPHRRTGPHER